MSQQPKHSSGRVSTGSATFRTPWGEGALTVKGDRLVEVDLPDPAVGSCPGVHPHRGAGDSQALERWVALLEEYFRSGRPPWSGEEAQRQVDELETTPFRRAVYRALLTVPAGETVSYGELAAMAGHPGAARAVGSAMAANPLALVVPCHRVVRSDGSPGRYGRCDACKPELLDLERLVAGWAAAPPHPPQGPGRR